MLMVPFIDVFDFVTRLTYNLGSSRFLYKFEAPEPNSTVLD